MTPEQRQRIAELLQSGQDLDPEWARILFPPGKREYELVYEGKEREEDILADTLAVPLQAVRTFGRSDGGWQNMLIFGDNLQVMKTLLDMKRRGELSNSDGSPGARLIYIDPPFATKQEFRGTQDQKAYQDKIVGARFLEFLRRRLVLLREVLSEDGSIYVHVDWKKCHYVRALLDDVFGENRFVNEIIWFYTNKYGANSAAFDSFHNTLYRFSGGTSFAYNPIRVAVKVPRKQPLRRWNKKLNKNEWLKGPDGQYLYKESIEKDAGDVWEIPVINPMAEERVGYPTQKPEQLLDSVIRSSSKAGDLVLDAFAGSGTACAVAEKLGRRWVGIDCGKLAIYTMQKRLLNLHEQIGERGRPLKPRPFTLFNAGLYDFSKLRELPWANWRFFALHLFQCKDDPHKVGGIQLDGYLKGADVLVFNHLAAPGAKVTYDTIEDLHEALGKKVGRKFFIIAPALSFGFQEDYVDRGGARFYALRIPYSIINELHRRDFTAIRQPADETEVNETVESVGFDFIRTPEAKVSYSVVGRGGDTEPEVAIRVTTFKSQSMSRGAAALENLESLSMVMVDTDYDGERFDLEKVFYAEDLKARGHTLKISAAEIGERLMVVLIDVFGNEFRELRTRGDLGLKSRGRQAGKGRRSENAGAKVTGVVSRAANR